MANQTLNDLVISGKVKIVFRWYGECLVAALYLSVALAVAMMLVAMVGGALGFWDTLRLHIEGVYFGYYFGTWAVSGLAASFAPSLLYSHWAGTEESTAKATVSDREHEIERNTLLVSEGNGVMVPVMTRKDKYNVTLNYTAVGLLGETRQEVHTVDSKDLYEANHKGDSLKITYMVVYRQSKLDGDDVELLVEVISPK